MEDSTTRFIVGLLSGYPICGLYYIVIHLKPFSNISLPGKEKGNNVAHFLTLILLMHDDR